ncbi:hypothetical protein EI77_02129 [Prosthecobacter fusiformis]|uniref:SLA1 homology domain-containing protein n=1 Tax=Prosthecobacter fusiformis TaxID=48464 RepID=A0A4R7RYS8_9BACT|nr:hypothetical protein [Prosthecobacter fusiformis]TDU71011.1 hypothetical protein EI77_02129 [Prosthecobacter fusiformis]
MIIWKGRGILILLFVVGGFMLGLAFDSVVLAAWGAVAGAWLFALTVGKTTQRILVDPQTQRPVVFKNAHTLYFIPPKGWAVLLTILALFISFIPRDKLSEDSGPAQTAFKKADSLITSSGKGTVHGNTPQAVSLAKDFAAASKEFRDLFIEKGKDSEFLTYVYLTPTRCVFLLHVPQLRKFSKEAKDTMSEIAWLSAQGLAAKLTPKPSKVALGIRGNILYDRAYIGHPVSNEEDSKGIDQEVKGMDAREVLALLFEPETETPDLAAVAEETPALTEESETPTSTAALEAEPAPSNSPAVELASSEAPPAVEPTSSTVLVEAPVSSLPTPVRDWKDSSGRPMRAAMIRFTNEERSTGEFKREDGQVFEVPLDRFSDEDKQFIQSLSDQ